MLRRKPRRDDDNTTQLHKFALERELTKILDLKDKKETEFNNSLVFKDFNDDIPLNKAAARGHFEIVKLLIESLKKTENYHHSIIMGKNQYSPLLSAVRWYKNVMDDSYFTENITGIFNTGETRDVEYLGIIELLLEEFPDYVNVPDNKGFTALYYATRGLADFYNENPSSDKTFNIKKVIEMLISAGATHSYTYRDDKGVPARSNPMKLAGRKNVSHILLDVIQIVEDKKEEEKEKEREKLLQVNTKETENKTPKTISNKKHKQPTSMQTHLKAAAIPNYAELSNYFSVIDTPVDHSQKEKVVANEPATPKSFSQKEVQELEVQELPEQNSRQKTKQRAKQSPKQNSGNLKQNLNQNPKDNSKENSKENSKDNSKDNSKEIPKDNSKQNQLTVTDAKRKNKTTENKNKIPQRTVNKTAKDKDSQFDSDLEKAVSLYDSKTQQTKPSLYCSRTNLFSSACTAVTVVSTALVITAGIISYNK